MDRRPAQRSRNLVSYIPQRGDLVWLSFDPRAGHEQGGRRRTLVLSLRSYNERTGLMLACPITSQVKGYAFEVLIDEGEIAGAVLADHLRSLDWRARRAELIRSDARIADEAARLVAALIGAPQM
jgi:mRNA interferase MazF